MKKLVISVEIIGAAVFGWTTNVAAAEDSEQTTQAEQVTISGQFTGSLTSGTPDQSAEIKQETPGAVSIKTGSQMKTGRSSNFEDLLQNTPGVFIQSENGAEVSKMSIRGSGITSDDEPIGVMFLLDGLNYNQGDGETILEDFDVTTLSHAEIFRGADAFRYGALTLGGAINLVPMTGYDSPIFQTRLEAGSFGYFRAEAESGAVEGPLDQFVSISGRSRDGFRDHSSENTELAFTDVGYKLNENVENRVYLTLDRTDRDLPGGLTKSEMEDSPERANPLAIAQDWNKSWTYLRLADKLTAKLDDLEFDAGLFWFHRDLEERGFFSPDFRQGIERYYSDNIGGTLNFISRAAFLDHRNVFTVGLSPQHEDENSQNFENIAGRTVQPPHAATRFPSICHSIWKSSFFCSTASRWWVVYRRSSPSATLSTNSSRTPKAINRVHRISGDSIRSLGRSMNLTQRFKHFLTSVAAGNRRHSTTFFNSPAVRIRVSSICRSIRNMPGPWNWARGANVPKFNGSCRFTARGCATNYSN